MENITKPHFVKTDDEFFKKLRQEVNGTVKTLQPSRKIAILAKAILFPALYIAIYVSALLWGKNIPVLYTCYLFLGVMLVVNFLNLIHEAVHHTLFEKKALNNVYVYFFDIIGANSYIWKIRHTRLHHNYPNVKGWDSDVEQGTLVRIFPNAPFTKMQRFQHIYMPLLYPLYLVNWLLLRDFKDFFNKKRTVWKVATIPTIEYVKLFAFKAFFLSYILVLPVLVLKISFAHLIIAFSIMMFTASTLALLVLLSPHANTESEFPIPGAEGEIPNTWFMHQLLCTNDLSNDSWFTRFFMGCFNYHIAHHLFPFVNHVYYPEVTDIIEKYAVANNLPYRKFTLAVSLKNHYRLLKNNAVDEDIFEETM